MSTKEPVKKLGRRPLPIILENFTELEEVANKSNRKWWKCNHCSEDPPHGPKRIEGRDNNLLSHLADRRKCPNVPDAVNLNAINCLHAKGQLNVAAASVPLPDQTANTIPDREPQVEPTRSLEPTETVQAPEPVGGKKRKRVADGLLNQYFDYAMTPDQEKRANIKLFRYVVTCAVRG